MKYLNDKIYAQCVIREVVEIIDRLANVYRLDPPIVVTSNVRFGDKKYHGKAQAMDVRTRDWPIGFMKLVCNVLQKIREHDSRIQFEIEEDHAHLEWDDNSL